MPVTSMLCDSENMDLKQINKILIEEQADTFILASFAQKDRELIIAFNFEGGHLEDKALLVKFNEAVIFHIPSVMHSDSSSMVFEVVPPSKAIEYIPAIRFDDEEFGEKGYKIIIIKAPPGQETGYYIAAESVEARMDSFRRRSQKVEYLVG